MIFDIRRTSLNDGPGIRTTVFLKGCNLNCVWCHNPEGINKNMDFMYDEQKCIICMKCEEVCKREVHKFIDGKHLVDRNKCNACGKCIEVCPTKSVEICRETVSVEEVLEIVKRDKVFYDVSDGGITISGGEPLTQKEFTFGLLYGAKSLGINTILDTNGCWNWDDVEKMLPYIDGFRYDLKIMDCTTHKLYTGVSNNLILENLKKLSDIEKEIIVVIPLIKEINSLVDNIELTALFLKSLSRVPKVQILPYHSLYTSKLNKLEKNYRLFSAPKDKDIEKVKEILKSQRIEIYNN